MRGCGRVFALYRRQNGVWKALPQPFWCYRADPFEVHWQGQDWVFYEEFVYHRNKGRLGASRLDGSGAVTVLDLDYHLSYPQVFAWNGQLWMVPESCHAGVVDLYVCEQFPARWRRVRRLLSGVDAADATLLREAERWWLFASVRPNSHTQRRLEIHFCDDLLEGAWRPHPVNEKALYAGLAHSTGRCAGPFLQRQGLWHRPIQRSLDYYGQGMALMQLETLTELDFCERQVIVPELPWAWSHHYCAGRQGEWANRKERWAYFRARIDLPEPAMDGPGSAP